MINSSGIVRGEFLIVDDPKANIQLDELDIAEKPSILVVADTPDDPTLLSGLLKDDYKVKIADDGEIALKIAMSESPPDLILLDIMMSGMDSYEVCRRLKRDPRTMNIPVIFLSAKAEAEDEKKGLELGAVDYITRPISPPIVMARVKNHLALKAMADFLQEKDVELEKAKITAEKADLAKSEFLSGMSHELRSPLNAILGFAQLMEFDSPPPTPSQKESIAQILQAGWHLLTLINEILDLAKVESGQVSLSEEPVSLAEVMLECQGMIEPQAQQRGIDMTFPQFDNPYLVHADRIRVKQVLINLLSNAIKFNVKKGTVKVTCAESTPGRIRVSIRDSGEGLAPEQLAQLFQPFNRLGQEAGGEEGAGVGLAIAKRLVELMGGLIGAESTLGVGSVFWFELVSVAAPSAAVAGADAAPLAQAHASGEAPLRTLLYVEDNPADLLYVEDNPADLKLVAQLIARHPDIRLLTAVSANSGIKIARASRPDVILMDINLPGISGIEALKILREDSLTTHIPVIAVSANAMPLDIERGLEAGFFRYITKPIKVKEFMDVVNMALQSVAGKSDENT